MERLQRRHLIVFLLPAMLLLLICISVFSCHESRDDDLDDDNNNDNDNDIDDDGATPDDDTIDDDTLTDDDTVTDDDNNDNDAGPTISNTYWEPNPTELNLCEDPEEWGSYFIFHICDPDNDLLPEGRMYFDYGYIEETVMSLEDFIQWPGYGLDEADNCDDPVKLGYYSFFGDEISPLPPGEYCIYRIQAIDTAGHFSNVLNDICIIHDPT